MAQKVLVQLVDDLDGSTSDDVTTVQFGLDGVEYEIDLGSPNAERLRKIFDEYVRSARRTGGRLRRGAPGRSGSSSSDEAAQVRQWAAENGIELASRGRIPSHVIEQYRQAQEAEAQQKAKTSSPAKRAPRRRAKKD